MKTHVNLVAILHLGFGILGASLAVFIYLIFVVLGVASGEGEAFAILSLIGAPIAGLALLFSVPKIVGGIWLLRFRPWARILVMILSAIDLVNFPFGTALGVYSLWVLVHPETKALFAPPAPNAAPSAPPA